MKGGNIGIKSRRKIEEKSDRARGFGPKYVTLGVKYRN
jgi:hypothetical protein